MIGRLVMVVLMAAVMAAAAPEPKPELDVDNPLLVTPLTESRTQELYREIRCLVCSGESLADSTSDFAKDVRAMIRQDMAAGLSDADIRGRLQARFGDQILMRPPFRLDTGALWLGPFVLLAIGLIVVWRQSRRRRCPPAS